MDFTMGRWENGAVSGTGGALMDATNPAGVGARPIKTIMAILSAGWSTSILYGEKSGGLYTNLHGFV